ncbi:MAG: hypothetical protein ACFFBD_26605 [Candidatus Hodarchaeota archaeon]
MSTSSSSTFSESTRDILISWTLLRENWKAFIATEIFAVIALALTLAGVVLVIIALEIIFPASSLPPEIYNVGSYIVENLVIGIILIAIIAFYIFLTCQYGLAYDIISSGDTFAEFKSSFAYFRKYWLQYSLLTLVISLSELISEDRLLFGLFVDSLVSPEILIIIGPGSIFGFIINFIWFILFVSTFPSLTEQGSLKKSLIENFQIIRQFSKRVFVTWALLYLIFYIPLIILDLLYVVLYDTIVGTGLDYLLGLFLLGLFLLITLISAPMRSLIATRIYSTTLSPN